MWSPVGSVPDAWGLENPLKDERIGRLANWLVHQNALVEVAQVGIQHLYGCAAWRRNIDDEGHEGEKVKVKALVHHLDRHVKHVPRFVNGVPRLPLQLLVNDQRLPRALMQLRHRVVLNGANEKVVNLIDDLEGHVKTEALFGVELATGTEHVDCLRQESRSQLHDTDQDGGRWVLKDILSNVARFLLLLLLEEFLPAVLVLQALSHESFVFLEFHDLLLDLIDVVCTEVLGKVLSEPVNFFSVQDHIKRVLFGLGGYDLFSWVSSPFKIVLARYELHQRILSIVPFMRRCLVLGQLEISKFTSVVLGGALSPVLLVKMHNPREFIVIVNFDVDVVP